MAYEPLSGWVQVTKQQDTGVLNHQRFHSDRACAENAVAEVIAKGAQQGRPVSSYLSARMSYAQASRLALLRLCRCSGGPRGHHIAQSDRRFGEVQGGSPGTGRRRVRGWAAQQLFTAFLFAETAARRISAFLRDATPDRNGDLCVPRTTPMPSSDPSHPTSGTPPGAPPIIDQPQAA